MKIAVVNLLMRTIRSASPVPNLATDVPKGRIRAETPMVTLVADEIARRGHDVDVFSGFKFDVVLNNTSVGLKTVRIRYAKERLKAVFPPTYYPFAPSVARAIGQGGYDAVISSEIIQPQTFLSALGKGSSTDLFIWQEMMLHPKNPAGLVSRAVFRAYRARKFRSFRSVVPRTSLARDFLLREGVPEHLIGRTIPNAVDCHAFAPKQGMDFFPHDDLASPGGKRILMIARLEKNKGADTFLMAAKMVLEHTKDVSFIIKGSGPEADSLRNIGRTGGLKDRFVLLEEYLSRQDLATLISSCDICVVPSSTDLFPIIPLEAMACGVPVIASTSTHHKDTFSDGKAGMLVAPEDPGAIASAIVELVEDPERLRDMSRHARSLAVSEFSLETAADRWLKILAS